LQKIAYGWEQHKVALISQLPWQDAADLALWCLQTTPERRPKSFQEILGHKFFDDSGEFHLLKSGTNALEPMEYSKLIEENIKQMRAAIKVRDLSKLKAVFDQGAVNVMGEMQLTESTSALPFHHAAMRGDLDVMKFLMAEVPALQLDHDSFSTQDKFSHFVSDILGRQDQFGYTALHWCAAYDHADVARELLNQGCNPSICNHSGKTAWDVAESAESTEVLALFEKLAQAVEITDAQILHVRGVKGRDKEDLAKIFEQFGHCAGIAVRRRQEADGGSWAFVIMDSAKSADSARMKLMPTNAYGLRVEKYNKATVRASTGAAAATQSKAFRAAGIARKAAAAKVTDNVHAA
jgi:hypothetical protein